METRFRLSLHAIDPKAPDGHRRHVGITHRLVQCLLTNSHTTKLARIALVNFVLDSQNTLRIFGGWCRPGQDDCYVYTGRPEVDYRNAGIEIPPPPGQVFCVFVTAGGEISDWRWAICDPMDEGSPRDKHGALIWKQSTIK